MADIKIEVRNLEAVTKNMERMVEELHGAPMLAGMRQATLLVQRSARVNSPVDTGRLRASIAPEVTMQGLNVQGIIGSNVVYAPFQELGTRYMQGKRYLGRALESNERAIVALVGDVVRKIVTS